MDVKVGYDRVGWVCLEQVSVSASC